MKLFLQDYFLIYRRRIGSGRAWLLLPPFISALLIMLNINIINTLSIRFSEQATLSKIDVKEQVRGGIRLAIHAQGDFIHIRTSRQKVLRISSTDLLEGNTDLLDKFLHQKIRAAARSSVLSSRFIAENFFVTLAVDEQLSYGVMKPILRSLAKAKLTRYGFEVKTPLATVNTTEKTHEEKL